MISLNNVSITYPLMQFNSHSLRARLTYYFGKIIGLNSNDPRNFVRGLSGINMHITHGEKVGIIGHNGAGKTTLLRTISGIYPPISGSIKIDGKISSLIDTTLGMDSECSGIKNIIFKLIYNGKTFSEAQKAVDSIAKFADLEDVIEDPIYTYSTGMALRLAFAIATYEVPEILIMDEIIGAGDEKFRKIALAKTNEIIEQSKIFIISSHDLQAIRQYCNKCILLSKGRIIAEGEVEKVIDQYLEICSASN